MNEAIVVALITGAAAIISNVLTSNKAAREMDYKLEKHQAVTDTKIEELTREVREHNNFARRTPVLEQEMADVKATVKTLQGYHMN